MPTLTPLSVALTRCTITYRDTGSPTNPAGPPLLLLHGSHGDWRHWADNLPALARHHRVIVPDMPGFGESSSLPDSPGPTDLAAALAEFIDTLALPPLTLVGFSFGCLIATTLAQVAPQHIGRLMLVHPPGIGSGGEQGAKIAAASSEVSRRDGRPAGMRETLSRLMLADASKIDDATVEQGLSMVSLSRLRTTEMSRSANLLPALASLPQPLHVLLGDRDPYHAHDLDGRRARLAQARGGDCVTLVSGAAHWLQKDKPREFEELLLAFAR